MSRPLEEDCNLKLFKYDSEEGRHTFWHSSAHILGQVYYSFNKVFIPSLECTLFCEAMLCVICDELCVSTTPLGLFRNNLTLFLVVLF